MRRRGMVSGQRAFSAIALGFVGCLALASCGADGTSDAVSDTSVPGTYAPGEPGIPIPEPTTTSSVSTPPVTTPEGGPAVVEWSAPEEFWCMADGKQAQITVGWSVPSATEVTVELDGAALPSGIQSTVPYQVLAGHPSGIGSTLVFDCAPDRHDVTITWTMDGQSTERTFTSTKAETQSD